MDLHEDVGRQIAMLALDRARPLVISDADEVLLQFVRALESYLVERQLYLDLTSFALTGNIKHAKTREALDGAAVKAVLGDFFEYRTDHVDPVEGAPEALAALSKRSQIVVLSNVPLHRAEARRDNLKRHGMDYPVIANAGSKGGAVRWLAAQIDAPVFFLDDIPRHLSSVAEAAAQVIRMHFVADPRLARLIEPSEDCHIRLDTWPDARAYIERHLDALR